MQYTQEQESQIVGDFWQNGEVRCPIDKGILDLSKSPNGRDYLLAGRCRKCSCTIKAGRENDPLFKKFRRWTEKEISQMKANFVEGLGQDICPVCNTKLRFNPIDGSILLIECQRCGEYVKAD